VDVDIVGGVCVACGMQMGRSIECKKTGGVWGSEEKEVNEARTGV
jgi:hypothetical protein